MSVSIQDLSDELVVRMATVLARRPEYGIAIPSRRWFQRQDEKIKQLPKELLQPSGLKRLAIKIADHIDPNIVDPQAVLCKTHAALNPFLIRRLFIALAYEVTVHTDALRSWEGRALEPELSALVGRLDSIVALWTAPELFHEIYGTAPFDGHHVFVKSGCEACCLSAVGASGRALADLRATLVNRMEERRGKKGPGKEPRLYRVVEAWIDQLRKRRDNADRSEQCRAWSEALLVDLRMVRPQIKAWRAKQKRRHAELRAAKCPVYTELRRTSTGARIKSLPPGAGSRRRTRNGIPVAVVDSEGAEGQRRAAMSSERRESIYRPDSLAGHSEVHRRERNARGGSNSSGTTRPRAPEPARMSGPSDAPPTHAFLQRFEHEIPLDNYADNYADPYEDENTEDAAGVDEADFVEQSREKVTNWFAHHVNLNYADMGDLGTSAGTDDARSVLSLYSMVHPAFRPAATHVAASAVPEPLDLRKGKDKDKAPIPPTAARMAPSEWTDCTVYSADLMAGDARDARESSVPPVPRIPSAYRECRPERHSRHGDGASTSTPQTVVSGYSRQTSTTGFPPYEDPFVNRESRACAESISSSSTANAKRKSGGSYSGENQTLPNWPAPPYGRVPDSPRFGGREELFLPKSDAGSAMSEQRHKFLVERFKPKEEPVKERDSMGSNTSTARSRSRTRSRHDKTAARSQGERRASRASSSVYSRTSVSSISTSKTETRRNGPGYVSGSGVTASTSPAERTSKPPWTRHPNAPPATHASSVTQLGNFRGKM